jgi:hypothetical protein
LFGVLTTGSLTGGTVAREQLLRPYPQYTGVTRANPAFGNSVYHSLQLKLEKRLSRGVAALISYTASKNLSDLNGTQNAYDRRPERAVSDIDVPQRLTLAAAWDLPFGRDRHFMTQAPRALDLVIGGWQLSTFQTYQGGFALGYGFSGGTFPAVSRRGPASTATPRKALPSAQPAPDRYFNTGVFFRPADFTIGNLAPGAYRTQSRNEQCQYR